jgi:hypothetical protein
MQFQGPKRLKFRPSCDIALLVCLCTPAVAPPALAGSSAAISVQGPGIEPQLGFACCDQGIAQMRALFADPATVPALRDLHAQVAVAIADFSPERAQVVRMLNQHGIPVIAWMMLPREQGIYLSADNAAAAASRVAEFERWTAENGLHWSAVGLDIEPNFGELGALRNHRWRLLATLLRNSLNSKRIERARQAYTALIRQLQSQGYVVQTYAMPYVPAERAAGSTLPDRLLGTVDVRGNEEYVMLYTSYARPIGAAMIWSVGPHAQAISVGVTDGPSPAGVGSGPLDWDKFSRDLIVASHFTHHIGVYNLEGCVRQGFLPRLETMNWGASVVIPAASVSRAEHLGTAIHAVFWMVSHLLYFAVAALLLTLLLVWRWQMRKRKRRSYS